VLGIAQSRLASAKRVLLKSRNSSLLLFLRQTVCDVVVVAFVGHENMPDEFASVGPSNAPMATPIQSLRIASQKSDEPQVEQNPRRCGPSKVGGCLVMTGVLTHRVH
jgi:hypothetical protein